MRTAQIKRLFVAKRNKEGSLFIERTGQIGAGTSLLKRPLMSCSMPYVSLRTMLTEPRLTSTRQAQLALLSQCQYEGSNGLSAVASTTFARNGMGRPNTPQRPQQERRV